MLSVRSEASELRYQTTESNGTFFLESERERERERESVSLSNLFRSSNCPTAFRREKYSHPKTFVLKVSQNQYFCDFC